MTRFFIAGMIVLTGILFGAGAFGVAVILVMSGWVTDSIDGTLARSSFTEETWVSDLDFSADLSLVYSFFLFVVITDLYPIVPALAFVLAGSLVVMLRPSRSTMEIVSAPIFALPIVLSFLGGLVIGICCVAFVLTVAVVRWDYLKEQAREAHLTVSPVIHSYGRK
jgi:phosphatidylglycerophosphate synthase